MAKIIRDVDDDILNNIFQLQKDYASILELNRYPKDKEERISALCTAIIHETIELQSLTSWKWWKQSSTFNQTLAKEELIDIWHFVVQASIELDMSPKDILNEYKRKNKINHMRQKQGY